MRTDGLDGSVGTATTYGLDGPGTEFRWNARFSAPAQTGPGDHPASYTMGTGYLPRVKQPERRGDHPTSHSAEVKGTVQSYTFTSPLGLRGPL